MLPLILGRGACATRMVLHCAAPLQRNWSSILHKSFDKPLTVSYLSTHKPLLTANAAGCVKPPGYCFRKSELFQKIQSSDELCQPPIQCFHSSAQSLKKREKPDSSHRELGLVRHDLDRLGESPKPARLLLFAGLIPLVLPTLIIAATENYNPEVTYAQMAFGATLLAFIGGARWGFTLPESSPAKPDTLNLTCSVIPPLLAWAAMLLSDTLSNATVMVIIGFGIAMNHDLSVIPTFPSWFKAMLAVLTLTGSFCLITTLIINSQY